MLIFKNRKLPNERITGVPKNNADERFTNKVEIRKIVEALISLQRSGS